jgi:hypothetical protein
MKRPNDYKFCVRTFRGYDCVNDLEIAESVAHSMVLAIISDSWSNEYWWAEIRQMSTGLSMIIVCRAFGTWLKTPFLRLT